MIVRSRRFIIAMFIYSLGVVIIATVSYWLERQRYMIDIDARLLAAASNIPSILPENYHDVARTSHAVSEEQDKHNLELMSQHARTGDLTYLYTYVLEEGNIYFTSCNYTQADIEKDQVVTYWTSYPEGVQEYFDAMSSAKPVYVTAGDRWGLFRTILIPMKSPSGQLYVAAADMDITVIQQSLLQRVLFVVGICLSMLLLAIPLVVAYRRTYSEMNTELVSLNLQLQDDITKAMQLESELMEATKKANAANNIKSQFLANMSHELRTPINGVLGMGDLLLSTDLSDEQREYATLNRQSAGVLLDTVNQILDLASIEAGGLTLKPVEVVVLDFFNDIALLFTSQVAEKRLELVMSLGSSLPEKINVDAIRLRQVLINLIVNAIKFTDQGGVHVSLNWQDGILSGEVIDNGCGIPKEAQYRIFESFQQVDNSSSRHYSGTGLGLPISREICRAMQGDLLLVNSGKQGSKFSFNIVALSVSGEFISNDEVSSDLDAFVLTESPILGAWLESEFCASKVGSRLFDSVDDVIKRLDDANLLLVDAAFGVNVLTQLSEAIDPTYQRLIWLSWSGQRLPEALRGKVDVLHKPIIRNRLLSLCHLRSEQDNTVRAQFNFSGRVLLVDDNPTNLKVMRNQMQSVGLDVDQTDNGTDALHLCLQRQYDLVLMDIQMPDMDGLEATRRIRGELAEQAPPIIGVSAHVMVENIASARKAGMADYLCKPVTQGALLEKISEFLS